MKVRLVGRGRMGRALHLALGSRGWEVDVVAGRGGGVAQACAGVDLVLLCVPDSAVAATAAAVEARAGVVVAHTAGSLGLDVLAPHRDRASLHPLMTVPDAERGARRLVGATFAVAGDPRVREVVRALSGRVVEVADGDRAAYHAAAVVASNHLVALLGQVERIAAPLGIPLATYLGLVGATVENVAEIGPAGALTGPASRGDWDTLRRHLAVLPGDERETYLALARSARRLATGEAHPELPPDL